MVRKSTAVISGFGILICVVFFFLNDGGDYLLRLINGFGADSLGLLLEEDHEMSLKQQVPCYFVFGDSLVDSGNNNYIETSAKTNYAPYGIDFPVGPTGRFTNGRTYVDFLAEILGFENWIPSYSIARDENLFTGINYGSGGSGILDASGKILGEVISMNKQLRQHTKAVARLAYLLGSKRLAKQHLKQCLYTVGIGNNDYLNNYFSTESSSSKIYTPDQFAKLLIDNLTVQLSVLYDLGARKIGVSEVGELGCTPGVMGINGTCVESINEISNLFNIKLGPLIDSLNKKLRKPTFVVLTSKNFTVPGINIRNAPCCQVSPDTGLCVPNLAPCENRLSYYYWDAFHPTQQVAKYVALSVYNQVYAFLWKENSGSSRILDH